MGLEANEIDICEYAVRLNTLLRAHPGARQGLKVFVATDDQRALNRLRTCDVSRRHAWTFETLPPAPGEHPDRSVRSYNRPMLYYLWAEITLLVHAKWIVGTLSSNLGKVVQLLRTQPTSSFGAVDGRMDPLDMKQFIWGPPRDSTGERAHTT